MEADQSINLLSGGGVEGSSLGTHFDSKTGLSSVASANATRNLAPGSQGLPQNFKRVPAAAQIKPAIPWSARRGKVSEKDDILRTVKKLLEKLTPENFDVLEAQLINAGINTADILQGVISLIYKKAVLEPKYCSVYSVLCRDLSTALPQFPSDDPDGKPISFRRILLNTCQFVFECADDFYDEIKQMTDPEQEAQHRDKAKMVKLCALGNLRFIGELFKQNMITEKIVHHCVQELLGQDLKAPPVEGNLEALCHLFNSIGKQLEENPKSRIIINNYFARMRELSNNPHLASRVRFMVRDLLDLRANKWIPRRQKESFSVPRGRVPCIFGVRPRPGNVRGRGHGDASPADFCIQTPILPSRSRTRNASLVPETSWYWKQHGTLESLVEDLNASPAEEDVEVKAKVIYEIHFKASMTSSVGNPVQECTQAPVIRLSVHNANLSPQSAEGFLTSKRLSLNGETTELLVQCPLGETTELLVQCQCEVEKDIFSAPPPVAEISVSAGKLPNELLHKTISFLEEYFSILDTREAKVCVEEIKWPHYYPEFVRQAILLAIKKGEHHIDLTIILLEYLYAQKTLSDIDIKDGIIHIAEECNIIAIDIPFAPRYLGDIIGKLTFTGATDLRFLIEAMSKVEDVYVRRTISEAAQKIIRSNSSEERAWGTQIGDLGEFRKFIP